MITKREGLILYLCEGDKFEGWRLYMTAITSTNPLVPQLFIEWLIKFYNIKKDKMRTRLHLWPDSNEEECQNFWSKKLGIKKSQFTKSYIKKKSGKNKKYPYGVCRVGIYNKNLFQGILREINKLKAA